MSESDAQRANGRVTCGAAEGWPYPPPPDDGAAAHLVAGVVLPDLELIGTDGSKTNLARIAGTAAIFIYPWTGRPGTPNPPDWDDIAGAHGSTPALVGLANLYTSFQAMDVAVVAISGQSPADQLEFAHRMNIPFPLLSDAEGRLAAALRLPTFQAGSTRYLSRLTLTAADGVITGCTYPVYPPHTHARAILSEVTAAGSYAMEARRVSPAPPPASRAD